MNIKTAIAIAVIAVAIAAVAGLVVYTYLQQQSRGCVLRVGTSPDFPPFEYVDEKGNIVGIDIDMVKTLANMIGCKVEIVSMDFQGLIPALLNKQIDVIASGMTITEERARVVSFTIPYWSSDQAIVVKSDSKLNLTSLDDLVNLRVGVQSGTTAEQLVSSYITGKNIVLKSYSSYSLAVQDLVNGRIDAVVVDTPVANMLTKKYDVKITGVIQTNERYGLAVRKEDTDLLNKLNNALQSLLNSQEWQNILAKYLGGSS